MNGKNTADIHIECVSDFYGNDRSPGAWADLFQRPDGSQYIGLGGSWEFYAPGTPEIIDSKDPHFWPFLESCKASEDFGYANKHWGKISVWAA